MKILKKIQQLALFCVRLSRVLKAREKSPDSDTSALDNGQKCEILILALSQTQARLLISPKTPLYIKLQNVNSIILTLTECLSHINCD